MRVSLKHIAILLFLVSTPYAIADLPQDADRSINVELAGFLYSQGVYKTIYGTFSELTPGKENELQPQEGLVIPDSPEAKDSQIEAWLHKSNKTIPIGVFTDE